MSWLAERRRRMIWGGVALFVVLMVLENFTRAPISIPAILKGIDRENLPLLDDGVSNDKWEIIPLAAEAYADILYDPTSDIYIVYTSSKIYTISGDGARISSRTNMPQAEKYLISPFMALGNKVIDLRVANDQGAHVTQRINARADRKLTDYEQTLQSVYDRSDMMFIGYEDDGLRRYPFYFHLPQGWMVFYSNPDDQGFDRDFPIGVTHPDYPLKPQLIPLNENSRRYPAQKSDVDIQVRHFWKDRIVEHVAYTDIPIRWIGEGVVRIALPDGALDFRMTVTRNLFSRPNPMFDLFAQPDKSDETAAMFMYVRYPSTRYPESKIYLIRRMSKP